MRVWTMAAVAAVAWAAFGLPATAAVMRLGVFDDWSAYAVEEGKGKICYVHSVPKKSEGKYSKRGDVFLQVTNRPAEKVANEVSFTAGYAFRDEGTVEVAVDGQNFKMFTKGDTAWAYDAQADGAIVKAMTAGNNMVINGVSSRNTKTVDTFSLKGFGAAHRASQRACSAGR